MILISLFPVLCGVAFFVVATFAGADLVRKGIEMKEAQHELKRGSMGWITTMRGWSLIAFWGLTTWFVATILGDWASSGDLQMALARSGRRLEVIIRIAVAIAGSDG